MRSRESRRQQMVSGVKVGRVATTASRRQRASQRCGGMRGWAALSSHRTSDVPVSGCAIGESMHVGCSLVWQWVVVAVVVVAVVVQQRKSESGAWESK
jgi:hypothetical protein